MLHTARRTLAPGMVVALLLVGCAAEEDAEVASLAAAAGATPSASEAGEVDADQAMLAFVACIREEGVDLPDPVPGDDGTLRFAPPEAPQGGSSGGDGRDRMLAASEACESHLAGLEVAVPGRGTGSIDDEAFLAFAVCMRDHGVDDYPDPGPDGRPDRDAMRQLDRDSAVFQTATETCAADLDIQGPGSGIPGLGRGLRG